MDKEPLQITITVQEGWLPELVAMDALAQIMAMQVGAIAPDGSRRVAQWFHSKYSALLIPPPEG